MKKCHYCGKELDDTAIRCKFCRSALPGKEAEKTSINVSLSEVSKKLFTTWKSVAFSPKYFFKTLGGNSVYPDPFMFVMIMLIIVMVVGLAGTVITSHWHSGIAISAILSFILTLLFFYFEAAIVQFVAIRLKGQGSSEVSFKIVAYSQAGMIVNVIPIIGGLIAATWVPVIAYFGIKELHKLDTGKSVLVLVCTAVCILLIFLTIVFLGNLFFPR